MKVLVAVQPCRFALDQAAGKAFAGHPAAAFVDPKMLARRNSTLDRSEPEKSCPGDMKTAIRPRVKIPHRPTERSRTFGKPRGSGRERSWKKLAAANCSPRLTHSLEKGNTSRRLRRLKEPPVHRAGRSTVGVRAPGSAEYWGERRGPMRSRHPSREEKENLAKGEMLAGRTKAEKSTRKDASAF